MAELRRPRRYYLRMRRLALACEEWPLAGVWRAKQEAQPGTPLPEGFPALSTLAEAGYTTVEDIDGADEQELIEAGLTPRDARRVLAELPSV